MHIAGEEDPAFSIALQLQTMGIANKANRCSAGIGIWTNSRGVFFRSYPSQGGAPCVAAIFPGEHEYPGPDLIVKFFKEQVKK